MRRPKLALRDITVRFPVITGRASVWSRHGLLSAGGCLVILLNGYRSRRERECRCDQGPGKIEDVQFHFDAPTDSGLFRRQGRPFVSSRSTRGEMSVTALVRCPKRVLVFSFNKGPYIPNRCALMSSRRWRTGSQVRVGTTFAIFWRSHERGHFRLRLSSSEQNTRR
jgi:hypothetical protein